MKHFYLFLGLVLLSFVACDNEINPLQPQAEETYIRFDVIEEEWPTKGTTTNETSIQLQSLGVLAYNIDGTTVTNMSQCSPSLMYNTEVSMTDGAWTYNNVKKWPATGTVNFFAYTPYEEPATSGVTHFKLSDKSATDYPSITYRMNDQSNKHNDLLVASALGRTKEGGTVKFTFKHALARIHFTAKLTEGCTYSNVQITQVSIKSSSFKNVGTLTFTGTECGFSWDNLDSDDIATDILMSSDDLIRAPLNTTDYQSVTPKGQGYLFLIPQIATLQLKVYYTFTDGSNQKQGISTVTLDKIEYKAEKAYNCQFELNPQPMTGDIPPGEYTALAALRNKDNGHILLDISPNGNDMGVKMKLKYDNAAPYTYPLAVMSGIDGQQPNQISRRFYFLGKHKESDGTIYFQVGWADLYGRLDNEKLPYNYSDVLLAEFHYLNQNEIAITSSSNERNSVTGIYERENERDMNLSEFFQAEVSSDLPISLFGTTMNDNTGSAEFKVQKPWYGTIYEVWISKGKEDILHLKPVQRNSDKALGMYDVIGAKFYPCSESSSFEAIAKPSEEGTTE